MCCGLSPRALLILISCWAIIQSIVYLVFSVIGILIKNCSYSMVESKFNYLLYLGYFFDGSCGKIQWDILGVTPPDNVEHAITEVTSRTGTLLYTYLVLSCVWIVSSMSLIVATFTPCMSLLCLKLFSFPWVVTCVAVLILDVVATVFHVIDITNTTTHLEFMTFLGVLQPEALLPDVQDVPAYLLPLPSVTMMIISIRGVIFWAINLSCLIYVIRGVRKMLKNELMKKNKAIRPDFGYEREFNRPEPNSPNSIQTPPPQMAEVSRYNDASLSNQYQYDNNGFTQEPLQMNQIQQPNQRYVASGGNYMFVSEKRYLEPLKGGVAPRSEDGMSSRLSNPRSVDSVDDVSRASSNLGTRSQLSERTIDYENEPAERLSYLSGDSMFTENSRKTNGGRSTAEPPPVAMKPSLVKQYVQSQPVNQNAQYFRQHQQIREEEPQARTSYQTPPDELRSQLPWSYFVDRDEMSMPQRQRVDDEPLPPVPVPDYTLHFPRRERPPTKPKPKKATAPAPPQEDYNDNPNEKWSGPEYTY